MVMIVIVCVVIVAGAVCVIGIVHSTLNALALHLWCSLDSVVFTAMTTVTAAICNFSFTTPTVSSTTAGMTISATGGALSLCPFNVELAADPLLLLLFVPVLLLLFDPG